MSIGRFAHLRNKKEADAFRKLVEGEGSAGVSGENGTASGTNVSASSGPGNRETVLNFNATVIPIVDTAGVVARATLKIYDFPAGLILISGAVADLTVLGSSAGVNATFNGDFALGTVAAVGDATLTATEANVIPSTPTPVAVARATTAKGNSAAEVRLDGKTTPVDLYLNILIDDADQDVTTTPANLTVSGKVTFTWANLGDN